jgi:poly(3-hydroxybutyrate) depolymerase
MFASMALEDVRRLVARVGRALGIAAALGGVFATTNAHAKTLYFPHRDGQFLYRFQHNGGAAVVPDGVDAKQPLPLVVFLHGTNPTGEPHMWLGGGGKDLRPLVKRLIESGSV